MVRIEFKRELKTLLYYIRNYGSEHTKDTFDFNKGQFVTTDAQHKFMEETHKGFLLAQDRLIELLTISLKEKKDLKNNNKIINRSKVVINKDIVIEKNKNDLITITYQEKVLRSIADTIAWKMIGRDITTARRLYAGEEVIDITNSNIESCIRSVNAIMQEDSANMALISDLTSFIQVGDILSYNYKQKALEIFEVKEGKVNGEILDILKTFMSNKCKYSLAKSLELKDHNFHKQFDRVIKQADKDSSVMKTIETGEGTDLYTGLNVKIPKEAIVVDDYTDIFNPLIEKAHKKGWSIEVIDNCLLIGVYFIKKMPSSAFEAWIEPFDRITPTYDFRYSFNLPTNCPLFAHDIYDNYLIDIALGDIVIKMAVAMDDFLTLCNKAGLNYKWLSKKETARINSNVPTSNRIFELDGRGIELIIGDKNLYLGDGTILRMFSMFTKPESAIDLLKESLNY